MKSNQLFNFKHVLFTLLSLPALNASGAQLIDPSEPDTAYSHRSADFLSLSATEESNTVVLQWTTLTEIGNSDFTIERSVDITQWQSLDTIKGAGFSENQLTYKYTDTEPLEGTSYYRIKQIDFNGTFSYSLIVAVTVSGTSRFEVYPQPATSEVNINLEQFDGEEVTISLHGFRGLLINKFTTRASQLPINMNSLENGIYFISIQTAHYHETKKIVKN